MTEGLISQFKGFATKAGIMPGTLRVVTNTTHGLTKYKTDKIQVADPDRAPEFFSRLMRAVEQYRARTIVISDWVALEYITQRFRSLSLTRGSVYFVNNIPTVVVGSMRTSNGMAALAAQPHAGWMLLEDCKKIWRWHTGTQQTVPPFHYTVCSTRQDLTDLAAAASVAELISCDVETTGRGVTAAITCAGYSLLMPDGRIECFVIPFISPLTETGHAWTGPDEALAYQTMRTVNASDAPKVCQNGMYDAHYYIRYRAPLKNFLFDTAVLFHSIWPEVPKRIDFIASIMLDVYRFWKDDAKEDDKDDSKSGAVPRSEDGYRRYLRYNALDCYYTLLLGLRLGHVAIQQPWIAENYRVSMRQFIGPGLAMSLRGVRINKNLQSTFDLLNQNSSTSSYNDLCRMVRNREFNPNSPTQVAALVYDVLKATPLPKRGAKKGGKKPAKSAKAAATANRSVDETVLEIIRLQHPLYNRIIQQIWDVKKPKNNASKYGVFRYDEQNKEFTGLQLFHGRWMYLLSPIGTDTTRYASKSSNFWVGTQIQNVPYEMRPMAEPDPGYVMFEIDYSKADFWHTAFASGEKEMMRVVTDPHLDTHCYHAARFFGRSYDEIYAGYKAKEPWVVDSLRGVRQNAKRIVYGANYLMAGYTLFMTMGKQAVDGLLDFLQIDRRGWTVKQYSNFCQQQLDFYFETMYPGLRPWLERIIMSAVRRGNKHMCAGGRVRTFFRDLINDKEGQRKLAAFVGQGGTAGMINRAMDDIYYSGLDSQDCMLLFQVHDSVVGQVRENRLDLIPELIKKLEITNTIEGRTFVVPVEANVGYGWGFRMCGWHDGITLDEIKEADRKWYAKNKIQMT